MAFYIWYLQLPGQIDKWLQPIFDLIWFFLDGKMLIKCLKALGTRAVLSIYICFIFAYGLISALHHVVFVPRSPLVNQSHPRSTHLHTNSTTIRNSLNESISEFAWAVLPKCCTFLTISMFYSWSFWDFSYFQNQFLTTTLARLDITDAVGLSLWRQFSGNLP